MGWLPDELYPIRHFSSEEFSSGNWRNGQVASDQEAFIRKAKSIGKRFNVTVLYDLYAAGFLWEHLMPLFHALPGKIFVATAELVPLQSQLGLGMQQEAALSRRGFLESDILKGDANYLHWSLRASPRWLVLSAGHGVHWDVRPGHPQFITLGHGVDEDHLWRLNEMAKVSEAEKYPSLSFSRYLQEHCHRPVDALLRWVNPNRPVILYFASKCMSCDQPCFISKPPLTRWCKQRDMPDRTVIGGLRMLSRIANVIVRPHPRDLDSVDSSIAAFRDLFPRCYIDDYKMGHSIHALAKLADVIISEPSAVMASALYQASDTALVYLLRNRSLYDCINDKVINRSMAEIFFPPESNSSFDLIRAVKKAMAQNGPEQRRARQEHFKRYYGDIDGYEEYRIAASILESRIWGNVEMAREVGTLKRILSKFTSKSKLNGVRPPTCDRSCCLHEGWPKPDLAEEPRRT
eukprot:TRINITY_DN30494_c0_g1_i1.p1 TRINITY_DN30494_c0_g1~~TRINITY_DN30494_c0_g1_i1.p1  ORF type:complete len:462 (+),score=52.52 TRINITY_DN30494_c0_g1_i1:65-1450(+)